jgi:hypothetical protein
MGNKHEKLGMNPSTAAHRLRVDLLFEFAIKAGHVCYKCEKPLTRDTFSIEHKEPWQKAADPKAAFFDLQNIAYSHMACNTRSVVPVTADKLAYLRVRNSARMRRLYTTERRQAKYRRTGH